jgi:cytochrome c5
MKLGIMGIRALILMAALSLAACGEAPQSAEERAAIVAAAETRVPADPILAEKYERACQACHADPDNTAPLSGDVRAWTPRLETRGSEGLLQSTLDGFEGMPPLGACPDCSINDFEKLIAFMAGNKTGDTK